MEPWIGIDKFDISFNWLQTYAPVIRSRRICVDDWDGCEGKIVHPTKLSQPREKERWDEKKRAAIWFLLSFLFTSFLFERRRGDGCGSFFARRTESFFDFNTPRPVRLTRLSPSIGLANRLGVRISHYWTARMAAEPSSARTTPPVIGEECTGGLLKKRRQCPLAANFRPLLNISLRGPTLLYRFCRIQGGANLTNWDFAFFYQLAHKNIFLLYIYEGFILGMPS